jgi:hypothetical protein
VSVVGGVVFSASTFGGRTSLLNKASERFLMLLVGGVVSDDIF